MLHRKVSIFSICRYFWSTVFLQSSRFAVYSNSKNAYHTCFCGFIPPL